MSQWTSKYAILRDLSVAQGRVPVALHSTVKAGEKPPALNITEETEEEYFDQCSGDAVASPPNYKLIKRMLDMVRDVNLSDDDDEEDNTQVTITKPNPKVAEFVPQPKPLEPKPVKKRINRNIAVESILQAIENKQNIENQQNNNENIKPKLELLKPNHFNKIETQNKEIIQNKETVSKEVIEKVNGWLETQNPEESPNNSIKEQYLSIKEKLPKKKSPNFNLEPTSMFKRKTVDKVKNESSIACSNIQSCDKNEVFKPSTLANEYYKTFLERTELKKSVRADIWSKAEEKMRQIDERKKLEAACASKLPSSSTSRDSDEDDDKNIEEMPNIKYLKMIALPQHRHKLTGECVVCQVLTVQ